MATSLISNLYTEPKDLEAKHSTHSLAELYVISNEQVGKMKEQNAILQPVNKCKWKRNCLLAYRLFLP